MSMVRTKWGPASPCGAVTHLDVVLFLSRHPLVVPYALKAIVTRV